MRTVDVVRAWKDPAYRASLTRAELGQVPTHPAGVVGLTDDELKSVSGLFGPPLTTAITCTEFTWRNWRRCCP